MDDGMIFPTPKLAYILKLHVTLLIFENLGGYSLKIY